MVRRREHFKMTVNHMIGYALCFHKLVQYRAVMNHYVKACRGTENEEYQFEELGQLCLC